MAYRGRILHHQADGLVGAGIINIPLWVVGVAGVSGFGEEEQGGVIVCAEGGVVDCEEEVACFIDFKADG